MLGEFCLYFADDAKRNAAIAVGVSCVWGKARGGLVGRFPRPSSVFRGAAHDTAIGGGYGRKIELDAVRQGELDVVIATERLNLRELEYRKLDEEVFVLVGSSTMVPPVVQPATDEERATLERWALEQPWVSYGSDLPIIRRFWRQCFGSRPAIEPRLIVPDLTVLAEEVAQGGGLSVLPAYLCGALVAAEQLVILWAPEPTVSNDLWLAYRVRDRQRPEIGLVRDSLLSATGVQRGA
jgi:DNA-binding transcriptional LysR family regulator